MQKRTEITIETERFMVIRQRRINEVPSCSLCGGRAPMLSIDEAARTEGSSQLEIFRLVDSGRVHFVVTTEGRLFVCPDSLVGERAVRRA